jgi:hypothetical protein
MDNPASAKSAGGLTDDIQTPISLETIADIDNLHKAYLNARKGKRHKPEVMEFEKNLALNLSVLSESIIDQSYQPSPPICFDIYCNASQKTRNIKAPRFKDQVVQHAIYQLVYNEFDKRFIFDSYGCRKGKGSLRASDRAQHFMRKSDKESYILQMDMKKFYYSIQYDILEESISRVIKDRNVVDLMMSYCNDESGIGLNIGNLLSQLYGLIYLDRLDHYIKRRLKQKYYVRYVDDFVVFNIKSIDEAKALKLDIETYINSHLSMSFSKWKIVKVQKGINFVGFRTWRMGRFVRKRTLHNFTKYLKQNDHIRMSSILEHSRHTKSYKYFINKIIESKKFSLVNNLHKRIRHDILIQKAHNSRCIRNNKNIQST